MNITYIEKEIISVKKKINDIRKKKIDNDLKRDIIELDRAFNSLMQNYIRLNKSN